MSIQSQPLPFAKHANNQSVIFDNYDIPNRYVSLVLKKLYFARKTMNIGKKIINFQICEKLIRNIELLYIFIHLVSSLRNKKCKKQFSNYNPPNPPKLINWDQKYLKTSYRYLKLQNTTAILYDKYIFCEAIYYKRISLLFEHASYSKMRLWYKII